MRYGHIIKYILAITTTYLNYSFKLSFKISISRICLMNSFCIPSLRLITLLLFILTFYEPYSSALTKENNFVKATVFSFRQVPHNFFIVSYADCKLFLRIFWLYSSSWDFSLDWTPISFYNWNPFTVDWCWYYFTMSIVISSLASLFCNMITELSHLYFAITMNEKNFTSQTNSPSLSA